MMEILRAAQIVRQRWRLVLAVTLIAACGSLALALAQPPRYAATARLLVTVADPARVDIEDPLAYDVPAIVNGQPFAEDVAAALAQQGHPTSPAQVIASLSATNQRRQVFLTAQSEDPSAPGLILQAAIDQLRQGGLRYWGSASIAQLHPGLNLVVLALPAQAERTNGVAAILREVGLRSLAGLLAGAGLALAHHRLTVRDDY
jgi:Chain length determinant protein